MENTVTVVARAISLPRAVEVIPRRTGVIVRTFDYSVHVNMLKQLNGRFSM
jgi:hypothetical protein